MPVFIPLNGPNQKKKSPKAPTVAGWQKPGYQGVDRDYGGWVGMRADDLVIVDCDSDASYERWLAHSKAPATYTVKTPRGYHLYYRWTPGSPESPGVDIFRDKSGIDIRSGSGSFAVVAPTPGYDVVKKGRKAAFKPSWMPQIPTDTRDSEGWTTIPEGRRDDTLMAIAGSLRRQDMAPTLIYQFLQAMNETVVEQGNDPITNQDLERIVRSAMRYDPQPDWETELELETPRIDIVASGLWQSLTAMKPTPPPQWHWQPYLPKGRLVLVDGAEGIGKGLFSVFVAQMVTSNGGRVLWMSAEDDPEEDIQRRLDAIGHNRKADADILFATLDLKFPNDIDVLEQSITAYGAELVILDPGRSFLAPPDGSIGFSYNDEAHVRPGLEALNRLAKRTGCTIIFVHHWNKNALTSVQYRSGGSGAFAQTVRHRITLALAIDDNRRGAFAVTKSNIAPTGAVYGYEVEAVPNYDTARFVPTEPLREFERLDTWISARTSSAREIEIALDDELEDAFIVNP